jgi:hypothetical protein
MVPVVDSRPRHKIHNLYFFYHNGTALLLPSILAPLIVVALVVLTLIATVVSFLAVTSVFALVGKSRGLRTRFSRGSNGSGYLPSLVLPESVEDTDGEKQQKLGIWTAIGILLVVAMLWGTNFASVKYVETLEASLQ